MEKKNPPRSLFKLTISMLIFGTIGLFRRWIPVSSGFLAFARGVLGASFLLLFLRFRGRHTVQKQNPLILALLVISGAAIGINWILLFEAYRYTTVAVATLCYYMQPTIVILLSPLLFREKLTLRKMICAGLAVLGMVLLSGISGGSGAGTDHRGIFLGLGAALLYSFVVILNKKLPPMDAYFKTILQLFSAAAVMVPYLLITGDVHFTEMDGRSWILLFVVGIVHTGIAYALYFGSMDVRAQTVAIFSYIDPVSALFFSWLFLHESLSPMGMAGAVLILGSAFVSEMPGAAHSSRPSSQQ